VDRSCQRYGHKVPGACGVRIVYGALIPFLRPMQRSNKLLIYNSGAPNRTQGGSIGYTENAAGSGRRDCKVATRCRCFEKFCIGERCVERDPQGSKRRSKEENQFSSESALGEEGRDYPSDYDETPAHHVGCRTEENRSGAARTLGQGQGGTEESCLRIPSS
jgi:hypothetical protein